MSKPPIPRHPRTEEELRDAESSVAELHELLAQHDGDPAAASVLKNWLRQQEEKAAKRRRELTEAEAFAGRLRKLREERKLTQVELAKRAGVGQAMVSLLEQGDRQPSWPTVCRLAQALGISVEAFI